MKRSIFVATLALTPALLHAQAATSAQTGSLQARLAPPAALKAAAPKDASNKIRVSTGVVAPQQTEPVTLKPTAGPRYMTSQDVTVVVSMIVDASGHPGELAIAQSGGSVLDQEVLQAITQYRFVSGKLDGENFALPMRLSVLIPRGTQY